MNSLHHFIPYKRKPLEHQWTCCFLGLFVATGDQFKCGLIDLLLAMDGHYSKMWAMQQNSENIDTV